MKGLTDIPGSRVGHVSDFDALTGCTVILCDGGAVGGVDIRGSATGSAELDVLSPGHVDAHVDAIVLAGGSAYGLEAAAGVRRYLGAHGVGVKVGPHVVPIVPAAILFDLGIGKGTVRPTREMGEAAAAAATANAVAEGAVGAGTGATVGKLFGMGQAMKGGIGCATVETAGLRVASLVVVNAFGDVRDPASGKLIAGARKTPDSMELADSAEQMKRGARGELIRHNTTLAVVATNTRLTKVEATKLAQLASLGMARTIDPVNTMFDGDIVFALAKGDQEADINMLGVMAAEAVAEAIVRAVRLAVTLGGVPGLGSR
jgi:L-aminopeptidase/D-esterase-like protein